MQIIHVPHATLRATTLEVTEINGELLQFISELEETLEKKRHPRGVGLSAPQVDRSIAVFSTLLPQSGNEKDSVEIRTFINPQLVSHSSSKTFGPDLSNPILEGCLSIPKLYGPVPRFEWVEYEYQWIKNGKLISEKERFDGFNARVMQHEHDHLKGILFTDYITQFELPLYSDESGKLQEIDRKIAKTF